MSAILSQMHAGRLRSALLTIYIAAGLTAGYFLWDIEHRALALDTAQAQSEILLSRISDTLGAIGFSQQSYIAPGQFDERAFERTSQLIRQLREDTTNVEGNLRSAAANDALQAIRVGTEALTATDTRARENIRIGQTLMAADVVFSDSRSTVDGLVTRVRELHAAERNAHVAERSKLAGLRWTVLGTTVGVWVLVVFGLARERSAEVPRQPQGLTLDYRDSETAPVTEDLKAPAEGSPAPTVDLAAAADLCTALARTTDATSIAGLLGRAANLVDASGVILWMGAGEELFAATSHGYRPQMVAKLPPIARGANNATAAAWRTGTLTTVAGDAERAGAVVAPMWGTEGCFGVLALELRHGREQDPTARAVATMIAAQLGAVVSPWPAASAQARLDVSA
jgi:hypothetical protein